MNPLDPAACSLLRDDALVARYNAVLTFLEKAVKELPLFGQREVVAEVREELDKLATTMTKKRFRIGFIGPSQIGKSKTVLNLLGVGDNDGPTPPGSSGPTTSVPCRTVHRPPADGAKNTITLHFYSKAEFLQRVRDICEIVKLRFDKDLLQVREACLAKRAEDPHFKAADMGVLLNLIDSALQFPEVLEEKGRVEPGVWEDRRVYMTHRNPPTPGRYILLREVSIEFVTSMISPEVEMIDLPGIDVDKGSDAKLTLNYVSDLDGAFMVQQGQQVKAGAIAQLAEQMRVFHGRSLGERVWMVVTRCDALNELQLHGPEHPKDEPTMFCHLAELMHQQGIKPSNVHFIGNEYYRMRCEAGLTDAQRATDALVTKYSVLLRFGADGQPVVPPRCLRNEGQVEPWRQFVLNGGIPALRETMQTKVADSVREQTRLDVDRRLKGIIDRLDAAFQAAEQQSGMPVEEMLRAGRWSGELGRLADEVGRDPAYSQAAASAIEDKLGVVIVDWGLPNRDRLTEGHEQLAGLLAEAGLDEATMQTKSVVARVTSRLQTRSQEQPPPDAAGLPKPLEHWSTAATTCVDRGLTFEQREFRSPIFRSFREDPSPIAGQGQNMSVADYPVVMRSKAARVARVYGSRLVHEIQSHLLRLQGRYRALGTDIDRIDRGRRELYATFRAELSRLR